MVCSPCNEEITEIEKYNENFTNILNEIALEGENTSKSQETKKKRGGGNADRKVQSINQKTETELTKRVIMEEAGKK